MSQNLGNAHCMAEKIEIRHFKKPMHGWEVPPFEPRCLREDSCSGYLLVVLYCVQIWPGGEELLASKELPSLESTTCMSAAPDAPLREQEEWRRQ